MESVRTPTVQIIRCRCIDHMTEQVEYDCRSRVRVKFNLAQYSEFQGIRETIRDQVWEYTSGKR